MAICATACHRIGYFAAVGCAETACVRQTQRSKKLSRCNNQLPGESASGHERLGRPVRAMSGPLPIASRITTKILLQSERSPAMLADPFQFDRSAHAHDFRLVLRRTAVHLVIHVLTRRGNQRSHWPSRTAEFVIQSYAGGLYFCHCPSIDNGEGRIWRCRKRGAGCSAKLVIKVFGASAPFSCERLFNPDTSNAASLCGAKGRRIV